MLGGKPFKLFRIAGIPIQVDYSWLFIVVLMTAGSTQRVEVHFPAEREIALVVGVATSALFFGSIFLHELAHAAVARSLGIRVHSVTLYMFGGATAAEVENRGPKEEFLVAVVGPFTSLFLAGVFHLSALSGVFAPVWAQTFAWMAFLNFLLAVFNIVPGYPLDGGRVLRSIVWGATRNRRLATRIASWGGQIVGGALIAWGLYEFTQDEIFGGIWSIFIGLFLFQGARLAPTQDLVRAAIGRGTVADVMQPAPEAIPAGISLSDALDLYLRHHPDAVYPVVEAGGRLVGLLDFPSASAVGQHDPLRPVRDAMRSLDGVATVNAEAPLDRALPLLTKSGSALALRDAVLVGVVRVRDVVEWAERSADAGRGAHDGDAGRASA